MDIPTCIYQVINTILVALTVFTTYKSYNTHVTCSGDVQNYSVLYTEYNTIPKEIRFLLEFDGWEFTVTDKDLADQLNTDDPVCALTICDNKLIMFNDDRLAIEYSLYHEVGHALDSIYNFPSHTDEFRAIYDAEKNSAYLVDETQSGYGSSTVEEYFASIVHNILKTRNKYKDTAPRSYNYVMQKLHIYER